MRWFHACAYVSLVVAVYAASSYWYEIGYQRGSGDAYREVRQVMHSQAASYRLSVSWAPRSDGLCWASDAQ